MKRPAKSSRPATKLLDHIHELRMRLTASVISLVVAGTAIYFVYGPILELLRSPLGATLYYSSPAGSFAFVMKICFMGALVVTIPILIYNLIMFVRPVFEEKLSLRRVYLTSATSALLGIAGAVFGFVFIIPGTLKFFAGFQVSGLNALISADNYLNFVTNVIITFILVFQLPLLITFIDSVHPLPPKKLLKMEKWVVLGSLIISLLVPFAFDLITCLLIAAPIVVLFNLSIIMVAIQHGHANRKARHAKARSKNVPTPTSSLALNEWSFEDIASDPIFATPQPVEATPVVSQQESSDIQTPAPVVPRSPQQRAGMDIRRRNSPAPVIIPVPRSRPQITTAPLAPQARVISDVRRRPDANRALA